MGARTKKKKEKEDFEINCFSETLWSRRTDFNLFVRTDIDGILYGNLYLRRIEIEDSPADHDQNVDDLN
uniref:MATH domain-containing protein n=1 Tax=Caenorhabditis tropicalis TaxID=1561998 RepID=A0A1I7UUD3_9PELO